MEKAPHAPRSLILSARLYQALLAIYPSGFRRVYGGLMQQLFRDSARRALREHGSPGLLALWGWTMLDTVQTAIEEHSQRGVEMTREKFIKLSGWALMLGGLAITLGWLAFSRPEYNRFNALSLPIDQVANAVGFPLIVAGLLLLSAGFTGLYLRYGQGGGRLGRFGLGLGVLSGVVSAIGLAVFDHEPWWTLFFFGMVVQFLGLALFGYSNLRQRALPRWNGLPLFAGVWMPLYALAGISLEQATGRWVAAPPGVTMLLLLLILAGLAGLGYLLLSGPSQAGAAAAG
jgi:hypothetical protein